MLYLEPSQYVKAGSIIQGLFEDILGTCTWGNYNLFDAH